MKKRIPVLIIAFIMCINLTGCSLFNGSSIFSFLDKFLPQRTISFNLNYSNPTDIVPAQKVKMGSYGKMVIPYRDNHIFAGWYSDKGLKKYFDLTSEKIYKNIILNAKWIDTSDETDTDADGLYDTLENFLRTDKKNKDTDGDGLSDYDEFLTLYLNPLKKDTDGNKVPDGKEDADGDGLTNEYEIALGISPVNKDTDGDGLFDKREIEELKTDPALSDSDGDGASDFVEVKRGTDPVSKDKEFTDSAFSKAVSENNPVSLKVTAKVPGNSFDTISVREVSEFENPFISSNIAGYIGNAFEITASGDINSAELEFSYDVGLGRESDSFRPRVYYFNEENNFFEEVASQVITSDGRVIASTTHFSTYILLNKVEFEKVWEADIKPPIIDDEGNPSTIDAAFAIDVSDSMAGTSLAIAKEALSKFVNALGEDDRASITAFNSSSSILIDLTKDKQAILNRVDGLDVNGLTAMYKGLSNALSTLTKNIDYGYRMVVILSDGEDVPATTYYSEYSHLVKTASDNGIKIYTIGVGNSVNESILREVARQTGGEYYHATTADNLLNVFEKLEEETIDLTTDSNNDKIPDYFSDLIKTGKLTISNGSTQFAGIDFNYDIDGNFSDDFDGDGIKNGDEIVVSVVDKKVYLNMISNPLYIDSDFDGITDKEEMENPEVTSSASAGTILKTTLDTLLNSDIYLNHLLADKANKNFLYAASIAIVNIFSKNFYPVEECKEVYLNYFNLDANKKLSENANKRILDTAFEIVLPEIAYWSTEIFNAYKSIGDAKDVAKVVSQAVNESDALRKSLIKSANKLSKCIKKFSKNDVVEALGSYTKSINSALRKSKKVKNFTMNVKSKAAAVDNFLKSDINSKVKVVDAISMSLEAVTAGLEVYETVSSYSHAMSNLDVYNENIELLLHVHNSDNPSAVKKAAYELAVAFGNKISLFLDELASATMDINKGGINILIDLLVNTNGVTKTIMFAYQALDATFGLSQRADGATKAKYIDSLTGSALDLTLQTLYSTEFTYVIKSGNKERFNRYATHLAQLRLFGEENYKEFADDEGIISLFKDSDVKDTNEYVSEIKKEIASCTKKLNLSVAGL